MANLTYPNTIANGTLADGDKVQENFDAVKTLVETTKLGTTNLQNPYFYFPVTVTMGVIAGPGASVVALPLLPAGITVIPAQFGVFHSGSAGALTCSLTYNSSAVLNSSLVVTSVGVALVGTTTSFAQTSLSSGQNLTFTVTADASYNGALPVVATLWCKALHQA